MIFCKIWILWTGPYGQAIGKLGLLRHVNPELGLITPKGRKSLLINCLKIGLGDGGYYVGNSGILCDFSDIVYNELQFNKSL